MYELGGCYYKMVDEKLKKKATQLERNPSEREWTSFLKVYFEELEKAEGKEKEELGDWFKLIVRNITQLNPGFVPDIAEYVKLCF